MSVEESVTRQMEEEIGEDELTKTQAAMLKQKYGLAAPQLTNEELEWSK